jgi:hypothetical protein
MEESDKIMQSFQNLAFAYQLAENLELLPYGGFTGCITKQIFLFQKAFSLKKTILFKT